MFESGGVSWCELICTLIPMNLQVSPQSDLSQIKSIQLIQNIYIWFLVWPQDFRMFESKKAYSEKCETQWRGPGWRNFMSYEALYKYIVTIC